MLAHEYLSLTFNSTRMQCLDVESSTPPSLFGRPCLIFSTSYRKKKAVHKATSTDDKRLQSTLKRLGGEHHTRHRRGQPLPERWHGGALRKPQG